MKLNGWNVQVENASRLVFPKNKDGETIVVRLVQFFLRVDSAPPVEFKRYRHRGEWCYRDSREDRPVTEGDFLSEVARLLFRRDEGAAKTFVLNHLGG